MRLPSAALVALATLAPPAASHAQSAASRTPIRAWMGVEGALLTNFSGIGASGGYRFTFEPVGGPSVGVTLGSLVVGADADGNGGGAIGYGAVMGGKSFDVGEGAFANASIGIGYGQGNENRACTDPYGYCSGTDARGLIVPVRLELHVVSNSRTSFGASITGAAVSPIGSAVGIGLHLNLGRNLRGER